MKKCNKCKNIKCLTDFYKDKRRKDGCQSSCKSCEIAYILSRTPGRQHKKNYCEDCDFVPIHLCQLDLDHIDGDHSNNKINNLKTLCANCHRLKTYNNKDYAFSKKIKEYKKLIQKAFVHNMAALAIKPIGENNV